MTKYEKEVVPANDFILRAATTVGSDTDLTSNCRGLLVGTAGSLNVTMANGQERDGVPFIQGITPGNFRELRTGGTAQNIWEIT